jgi:hypothetical protein
MNHLTADELLRFAYGEASGSEAPVMEAHLVSCASCRAELERFDRPRAMLEAAIGRRARSRLWLPVVLAAAALLAAVLVTKSNTIRSEAPRWQPVSAWSSNAGYLAGGNAVVEIDAQLTRLEQERSYVLRNY